MKNQNIDQVLSAVGLQRQMVWKTDTHSPFNELIFETYAPAQTKSEYQQEMDHIYRMSDIIVLHRETGLRVWFSEHESYFGDELTYKAHKAFVIDNKEQEKEVTGLNMKERYFETANGLLPFSAVKK